MHALLLLPALFIIPVLIAAARYRLAGQVPWQTADRGSANLLPPATNPAAPVGNLAARTVRWRGVVASHCWIVVKPANAAAYTRYDYTAWGNPIRRNGFVADGRWFGATPSLVYKATGLRAAAMIPHIEAAVRAYRWRHQGDYRAVPGPNSNSFVAAVIDAVPGMQAVLPPTAIGKDFPRSVLSLHPRRTPLHAGIGGVRTRRFPVRRHRPNTWRSVAECWTGSKCSDKEGNDLLASTRRHGVHRTIVRLLHAPCNALDGVNSRRLNAPKRAG